MKIGVWAELLDLEVRIIEFGRGQFTIKLLQMT